MTDSEFVFLDTSPIIYVLENNREYCTKVSSLLTKKIRENATFVTSVVSIAEFGVKPKRTNNLSLLEDLDELIRVLEIQVKEINRPIADLTSTIRAKYPSIKNFDALQIATAVNSNCSLFLTNDKKLKVVDELRISLIEDLE
jgi:predicted nucleic acid-binding protein